MLNAPDGIVLPEALNILYRNAGPIQRRNALKSAASYLQTANRARIKTNVLPDGAPMPPKRAPANINPRRFSYVDEEGRRSVRTVLNGHIEGAYFLGFDEQRKALRRFHLERMRAAAPTKKSLQMFKQLWKHINRWTPSTDTALVGFDGWVAPFAAAHHYGNDVIPRALLGINAMDAEQIKRIVLDHLTEGVRR